MRARGRKLCKLVMQLVGTGLKLRTPKFHVFLENVVLLLWATIPASSLSSLLQLTLDSKLKPCSSVHETG